MRAAAAVLAVVILMGAVAAAQGFSGGPPNGKTGAPGEGTCGDCHGNLNIGDGRITVSAPSAFTPGESPGWTLEWTSPEAPLGAVTFYIAGNAANGDGFNTGDFIHTNVLMYGDDQTSAEALTDFETTWGRVKALFQ